MQKRLGEIVVVFLWLILSQNQVWAQGTPAGSVIANTAFINYEVNPGSPINVAASSSTVVVDSKINLSLIESTSNPTIATSGQNSAVTTFTLSNLGNSPQDYQLSATNNPNGTTVFTVADSFDATSCATFIESSATPNGYQVALDTATFVDELAPDASVTIYVVCDIPAAATNGQQAAIELQATTRAGGAAGLGGAVSASALPTTGVDIVFVDPATVVNSNGTVPAQIARDALAFARSAYRVNNISTNITKAATCSPAPANCSQAKSGTTVSYKITVNVVGTGSVDNLVISDPLPAELNYTLNSIKVNGASRTDASDTDNATFAANTLTVNLPNNALGAITAPASFVIDFITTIK